MEIKKELKKFWDFLNEDSWQSTVVSLIIFLILIYFIIMPFFSLVFGTKYFLVIVESCSMHHSKNLDEILEEPIYKEYGIHQENSSDWRLKRGFTKGDIIFSIAPRNLKVGDVIIFDASEKGYKYPIIHRIIKIEENKIVTKGDNNKGLLEVEKNISSEQVKAKSLFRIPYIGWIKLIFFDWKKPPEQRGFCK
ncbi:MAG: signal peptidase I [Candidatus Pacearchaeota archaeon]